MFSFYIYFKEHEKTFKMIQESSRYYVPVESFFFFKFEQHRLTPKTTHTCGENGTDFFFVVDIFGLYLK